MAHIEHIAPVSGAAEYTSGIDPENGKPCVFMADTENITSVIEYARTPEAARAKALKWQKKENSAVLKSRKNKK